MNDSLYRNSIYLLANMLATAGTGFIFWTLAAHLFSTNDVGRASALNAAVTLVGSLSSLGLAKTVIRFLAKSDNKSRDLVSKLSISIISTLFFALLSTLFLSHFKVGNITTLLVIFFILSCIVNVLKTLFDNVFIAFRAASHTLIENSFANVSKILILLCMTGFGFTGIFVSQTLAISLALLVSIYLLSTRHSIKFATKPSLLSMNGRWSFSIGSYFNDIIGNLPNTVIPLLIVAKIGPSDAAYWYMSMQIATILFQISASVNQSLFAEAANQEKELMKYIVKAAKIMFGIVVPLALIIIIAAPRILSIFGSSYIQGTGALRLLALSSILVAGNYITGTILNMFKKIWYLAIVNLANAVFVVGGSILFGNTITRFALIWIIGEVINIILFSSGAAYVLNKRHIFFASSRRTFQKND